MNKPDWARKKINAISVFRFLDRDNDCLMVTDEIAIRLLRNEHRRAVRVVAQVKAKMHENIVANNEWIACKLDRCYLQACDDLLAALRKERT